MKVVLPGVAVTGMTQVRVGPEVVDNADEVLTSATTLFALPLMVIETDDVEGERNCGRTPFACARAANPKVTLPVTPAPGSPPGELDAPPPPHAASVHSSAAEAAARTFVTTVSRRRNRLWAEDGSGSESGAGR